MVIINSLKQLNIITFLEILQDNNFKRLDKDYDENKEYSDEEIKTLELTWLNLYDEYFSIKNDHKAKSYLSTQKKIVLLEATIQAIVKNHDVLANLSEFKQTDDTLIVKQKVIANIKEIDSRIKLNIFDDIHDICQKLQSVIKSLTNELGTIKNNQSKRVNKNKTNVYKIIAHVEQVLERSLGDISKISVIQWLAYEEMANDKLKSTQVKKK